MTMRSRYVRLQVVAVAAVAFAAAGRAQTLAYVAATDGTQLATDVYHPFGAGSGPWPVILVRTPYGRSAIRSQCLAFNIAGYACVAQDVRGRGDSTGTNTVFRNDTADGQTTIQWLARQVWCNGRIGTFGPSALGITQYHLAPGAPVQLRCQLPIVATPDFYHNAAFFGGALRHELTYNWLAGQNALYHYQDIKAHRTRSSWWQPYELLAQAASVNIPGLHIGGWYDIFSQGTLDAFSTFQSGGGIGARGRQYLIIGPWTHYGTGSSTVGELIYPANATLYDSFLDLFREWFDYWLRDKKTGVDQWPAVRIYVMGAAGEANAPGNEWVALPEWPPASLLTPFFLTADRALVGAVPHNTELELVSDPGRPIPTRGGANLFETMIADGQAIGAGPFDQRSIEARDDVLVFSTAVLEQPLKAIGRIRCRVWLRSDTPDLDIAVRLTDVYPDGRSMLVADGIQRARMRCGDDRECFLTPDEPTELVVDLWSTALVFNVGHRIRVDVSGSNYPRFEVNPNDGRDPGSMAGAITARPRIMLGGAHASRLELPVVPTGPLPRRRLGYSGI